MNGTSTPPGLEDNLLDLRKRRLIAEITTLEQQLCKTPAQQNWFLKNVSFLTFALALIGLPIGLWQYFEKAENEYKKPLWEKQLNYYLEATRAAASIAVLLNEETDTSKVEWQKERVRFWQLYYGELVVVEDPEVSKAMVAFGKCLRQYELSQCDQKTLKQLSLDLAQACRTSVGKSWKEPLGKLDREEH